MGSLESLPGAGAQAERMIQDPLGQLALRELLVQWFSLDTPGRDLPGIKDEAATLESMLKESVRFIDHVVQEQDASYKVLLGAPYTFLDERMARFHGLDPATLGKKDAHGMWRVEGEGRAGILTHAAVLSQHNHYNTIHRGKMVRQNILCDVVADLENQDLISSIETREDESQRDQALKRMTHPTCKGCHNAMEPLGLTFDVFDDLGRLQSKDTWGNDVHGQSVIVQTQDVDGQVSGPVEFVGKLLDSKDVEHCVATQLFAYTFARPPRSADRCTVGSIQTALADSSGSLSQALLAVVAHETFVTTTPSKSEAPQ